MNMNDGVITGKAMWCHLADTETFNGTDTNKYSITLVPSVEDMNNLMQEAQTIWEEFKETLKNKKFAAEPNMGSFREDDKGDASVKFVTNAHIVTKAGKEIDKVVPVFDGAERPVTRKIKSSIGNGSVVDVAYQLFPYYNTSKNFGVSFRLQAVQLLKYVPYGNGQDASSFGFKKHEGAFDSTSVIDDDEEDTRSDVDVPFTDGSDDEDF